jgi:hypothetical protein
MTAIGPIRTLLMPAPLDRRLPEPNSLRRASDAAKAAVAVAVDALAGSAVTEETGLYVGQQQVPLEYCQQFIDTSYRNGPRFASPMLFSESVANNAATHLSLTLGFRGALQTFIGSRTAGIGALLAAAEDVRAGTVESGLVVVLSFASPLTVQAYEAVYRSKAGFPLQNGAAAFRVRREAFEGSRELARAGLRCRGRTPAEQRRALKDLDAPPGAKAASVFWLAREESLAALREAMGEILPRRPEGESFALDPFLALSEGGPRTVVTLGEEGTAGLVALA